MASQEKNIAHRLMAMIWLTRLKQNQNLPLIMLFRTVGLEKKGIFSYLYAFVFGIISSLTF